MLQSGGVEVEIHGCLPGSRGMKKDASGLHYGKGRIQCFWSLILAPRD